jgi:hypothetical protein
MQTFVEFMAESYRSHVGLTWNLAGSSHATATFTVEFIEVREPDRCVRRQAG